MKKLTILLLLALCLIMATPFSAFAETDYDASVPSSVDPPKTQTVCEAWADSICEANGDDDYVCIKWAEENCPKPADTGNQGSD